MSSLHQDRPVVEGSTPASGPGSTEQKNEKIPGPRLGKAQRTGVEQTLGTAEKPAAAESPATKPAATGSRRTSGPKHAAPVVRGAALAARARAAGAATTKAATKTATKVAATKVAARARVVKAPVVKTPAAVVVTEFPASVDAVRAVAALRPADVVVPLADGARPGMSRWMPAAPRRPALYLATVLVGALGVSVLAAEEPTARAGTTTVSAPVSVADRLSITGGPDQPITAADAARLGELAVSRNERSAEQDAAARAQDAADRTAAAAAAAAARPDAVLPVTGARLTSGFGGRWGRLHAGIDLAAPIGTPEYAVMDGIVLEAGPSSGYGNAVYIQHDNGDVTVYGHMEKILVAAGQVVRAGETIALLGNRGRSTGPHLHFEVHVGGLNGQKIDPIPWLRERGINV
jgi:murein DD-endopeptidase MepM/ murein hydrolase activator NlpD